MEKIFPAVEELIAYIDKTQDHFTLMKFSSGWKAMKGTPCMDDYGYAEVELLSTNTDPEKAISVALLEEKTPIDVVQNKVQNERARMSLLGVRRK